MTDHFHSIGHLLSHTPTLQKEHFSATGHHVSDRLPLFSTNLCFIYCLLKQLNQYGFSRLANNLKLSSFVSMYLYAHIHTHKIKLPLVPG